MGSKTMYIVDMDDMQPELCNEQRVISYAQNCFEENKNDLSDLDFSLEKPYQIDTAISLIERLMDEGVYAVDFSPEQTIPLIWEDPGIGEFEEAGFDEDEIDLHQQREVHFGELVRGALENNADILSVIETIKAKDFDDILSFISSDYPITLECETEVYPGEIKIDDERLNNEEDD